MSVWPSTRARRGAGSSPEERVGGKTSVRLPSDAFPGGSGRFRIRLSRGRGDRTAHAGTDGEADRAAAPRSVSNDRRASRNDTRQFASRRAGDARLARLEAPGEVSLRETPAPPPVTQARRQSRLEIDIRSLLGAQVQKFLRSPNLPALCLQPPSLVLTHDRTPSVCETIAAGAVRPARRCRRTADRPATRRSGPAMRDARTRHRAGAPAGRDRRRAAC